MTRSPGPLLENPERPPGAPAPDPLSDVLRAVRLTGAVFFRVDASSPWVIEMPDSSTLATVTRPSHAQVPCAPSLAPVR